MTPKKRFVNFRTLINDFASWFRRFAQSATPIVLAICCLGYYVLAESILPLKVANATFWILFVLGLGPRASFLRLLRAVLGAVLDSLN